MATTQYIGARYVPLFADPAEWNNTRTYEPLTIVMNEGNSYTSKQYVPKGIDISNEAFWALTGNYNAQVEQYRQTVTTFNGRITANKTDINTEITRATKKETELNNDINNQIMIVYGDSWSDFTESENNWSNLVAKQLGCIRKNYSKSGATITNIGESTIKTLEEEVTESINELQSVSTRVRYIYILMGVNDATHNATNADILSVIAAQTTRARNAFPKAKIHFSFNFPCYNQAKYMPYVNYFKSFAYNRGYIYVDLGSLMFAPALYKTDKLHPTNGAGTGYIAGRMLGSQTDVVTDDYRIKNDAEGVIAIHYTPLGAVLYIQFKGETESMDFNDMQFKFANTLFAITSDYTGCVLTTKTANNYTSGVTTTKTNNNAIWYGFIYG